MATPRKKRNGKHRRSVKAWVIENFGQRCWLCGTALPYRNITMDHIKPLKLNGPDQKENMKPACSSCNLRRGNAVNRLTVPKFYRMKTLTNFDLMLERMVFVERQLQKILRSR